MPAPLVWKPRALDADAFTARKPNAVRGQYLVVRRTTPFDVWNRRFTYTDEMQSRFLGHAATADEAKAIAQTDADQQHGR
jgi:hypothetical protein